MEIQDVDDYILVGGSSHIPKVAFPDHIVTLISDH
jgi:hypothetical protein